MKNQSNYVLRGLLIFLLLCSSLSYAHAAGTDHLGRKAQIERRLIAQEIVKQVRRERR